MQVHRLYLFRRGKKTENINRRNNMTMYGKSMFYTTGVIFIVATLTSLTTLTLVDIIVRVIV